MSKDITEKEKPKKSSWSLEIDTSFMDVDLRNFDVVGLLE